MTSPNCCATVNTGSGGGRILKYHGDPLSANRSHLVLAQTCELDALELYGARGDLSGVRDEPQDGERRHAFPATCLTYYAEGLPLVDVHVHTIESGDRALLKKELRTQSPDLKNRCSIGGHLLSPFSLGSRTSRRPSPRRLKPRIAMSIASPGKVAIQGDSSMKVFPLYSM